MNSEPQPIFIGEEITVAYDRPQVRSKTPRCPDRFSWQSQDFTIVHLQQEWHDFSRRGRKKRNMQPQHAERASRHGSWGVGRYYFRVATEEGRIFDIYYDRAPRNVDDRSGQWMIFREWPRTST